MRNATAAGEPRPGSPSRKVKGDIHVSLSRCPTGGRKKTNAPFSSLALQRACRRPRQLCLSVWPAGSVAFASPSIDLRAVVGLSVVVGLLLCLPVVQTV